MRKTITALTSQKRNPERVNVFLDGEYAFSLGLNVALGLKRGQSLSQVDIERLQGQDEALRAYHRALRLLGYRPRSQAEIKRHLSQKGYATDAIDTAIKRLVANHYLDDEAFAEYWRDNRQRFRPRGSHALRHELRQKGVDRDIVDTVLTDLDEEASAWAAIEGKLGRWGTLQQNDFRKKVMGFLSRRGFGYSTIRTICQRAWDSLQTPDGR